VSIGHFLHRSESEINGLQMRDILSRIVRPVKEFILTRPWHSLWGFIAFVIILLGVFAPIIAPYNPLTVDFHNFRAAPDSDHWFGTDNIGRDIASRIIYGARSSLIVAACAVTIGTLIGVIWGIVSGYLGGKVDLIAERFVEILMALPGLIFAYMLVIVLGPSMWTVIFALSVTRIPTVARTVRSVVLVVKQSMYIEAARAIGASQFRIMWRHVLPQCVAVVIVLITINIGGIIIAEASLSYLGVGINPPTPSWGKMLAEAGEQLYPLWWFVAAPGVFITLTVLAFNLFGDGLRDALDPRLRGTER